MYYFCASTYAYFAHLTTKKDSQGEEKGIFFRSNMTTVDCQSKGLESIIPYVIIIAHVTRVSRVTLTKKEALIS